MTAELHDQISGRVNPPEGRPEGLLFHRAGPSPDGAWRIIDVWDSRATFDPFLEAHRKAVQWRAFTGAGAPTFGASEPRCHLDQPLRAAHADARIRGKSSHRDGTFVRSRIASRPAGSPSRLSTSAGSPRLVY